MLCLIWITDKKREFVLGGRLCMKIHFEPLSTPGMRFLTEVISLMMYIVATCLWEFI